MFHAGTGAFTTTNTTATLIDGTQMTCDMQLSTHASVYAEFLVKSSTSAATVTVEIVDQALNSYGSQQWGGLTDYSLPVRFKLTSIPPTSSTTLQARVSGTTGTTSVKAVKLVVIYA
jgi:hypothetical protein